MPLRFLRRLLSIGLVLAFSSCLSPGKRETRPDGMALEELPQGDIGTIRFNNNTQFTVHLVQGSGRKFVVSLKPYSSELVPNNFENAQTYYPLFDVPLTSSYTLERIRPEDTNFYYLIDKRQADQKIEIQVPPSFYDTSTYIVFTNNNKTGGIWLTANDNNSRMKGFLNLKDTKYNINQGETIVYQEDYLDIRSLRVSPNNIKFGEFKYQPSYVYYFTFNGLSVTLTDSRPLHRVGESAWVKPIPNATGLMPVTTNDGAIHLFASTEKEINRIVYDSAGIDNNTKSFPGGDSFNITYASAVKDDFFIAGYKEIDDNKYKPYVRILSADGVTRRELPESIGYKSVRLYTVAEKGNTFLLAGDGIGSYSTHTAYARLVRDDGNKLTVIKEWGGNEFPKRKDNGRPQCGDIIAAVYNNKKGCWLITGSILNESFTGSYLARINNDNTIQIINKFEGIDFYKILADEENGDYYLAGQEQNGHETFAALFKYNADDKQIWQLRDNNQPPSHSYYNDAIFDTRNGKENTLIVLAGTLQAKDEDGNGGKPFIEAVDITGKRIWQEKLIDTDFAETSLVTAVALAPHYGYVLSLSGGIEKGYFNRQPFKIARLNSFGKRFKYTY